MLLLVFLLDVEISLSIIYNSAFPSKFYSNVTTSEKPSTLKSVLNVLIYNAFMASLAIGYHSVF